MRLYYFNLETLLKNMLNRCKDNRSSTTNLYIEYDSLAYELIATHKKSMIGLVKSSEVPCRKFKPVTESLC